MTSLHPLGGVIAAVEPSRKATVATSTVASLVTGGRSIVSAAEGSAVAAIDDDVSAGTAAGASRADVPRNPVTSKRAATASARVPQCVDRRVPPSRNEVR
jgi:hypothetical protein